MPYRTYETRILQMLARHENPEGMHRATILAAFDRHKDTYVIRALRKGVAKGSMGEVDDVFRMNWSHVNVSSSSAPSAPSAPSATESAVGA